MRILDRYIGMSVAGGTLVVMLVLLSLYSFVTFAGEANQVGRGDYTMADALFYTLLSLPGRTYELFPLAALLGSMIGLGTLAGNSELIVMRAAGLSLWRIIIAAMKAALVLMVLATFVGEVLAPPAERYAKVLRLTQLTGEMRLGSDHGLWARDGDTFINVRRVHTDGRLVGVSLYAFDEQRRLASATYAATGIHDGRTWQLEEVRRSEFVGHQEVRTQAIDNMAWDTLLSPELVQVVAVSPEMLSTWDLYAYIGYLRANNLDAARYELAMWTKVAAPLATGIMVLLSVPFMFGSLRSVGVGQRLLVGILLGIGFYLFNQIFGRVGLVYDLSPALSAVLPTFLVFALALLLIRRVR